VKRCSQCNSEFADEHNFCEFCGTDFGDPAVLVSFPRCLSCRQSILPEWRFCKHCSADLKASPINQSLAQPLTTGTITDATPPPQTQSAIQVVTPRVVMRCHSCKGLVDEDSSFCELCGANLSKESPSYPDSRTNVNVTEAPLQPPSSDAPVFINESSPESELERKSQGKRQRRIRSPLAYIVVAVILVWIVAVGVSAALFLRLRRQRSLETSVKTNVILSSEPKRLPIPEGMVYVAGGAFLMGRDDGDEYERPAHEVSVTPFFIDKLEVSCGDYQRFIDATGHQVPSNWNGRTFPAGAQNLPVTGVNWDDANAYAEWIGKRLPTEEEWEFAARQGDGRRYPWGNDWRADAANVTGASAGHLVDVGSFPEGKTAAGVMDLVGNAWEWTANDLKPYPGGDFSFDRGRDFKVIRGGSWKEAKDQATTTYRGYLAAREGKDYSVTGFRCAKNASSEGNSAVRSK
jgi:formylglycine-generating enzyme required for sulfatase activity/RNA polymerase subunit RPABC4/transcription elongation factor Spt4